MKNFENENFEKPKLNKKRDKSFKPAPLKLYKILGPGIFVITCKITNCSLLVNSEGAVGKLDSYVQKLYKGSCKNKELLKDFQLYGKEAFDFHLLVWGPEWKDPINRKKEYQHLKSIWPYSFY